VEKGLGKGVTTDRQLTRVGRLLLGKCYLGTFSSDVKPIYLVPPAGCLSTYFIINNMTSKAKGEHWIAVARVNGCKKYIIYDSFARKSRSLIPAFIKTIGYQYLDANKDGDQKASETNCGQRSLAFLLFLKRYGVKAEKLV
jgi:hypothetical protein